LVVVGLWSWLMCLPVTHVRGAVCPSRFVEFPLEIVVGDALLCPGGDAAAQASVPLLDDAGEDVEGAATACFLVTPHCPHELSSLIAFKRKASSPPPTLLDAASLKRMSWELLTAVAQLHGRNIIHRNITTYVGGGFRPWAFVPCAMAA